jgi:hypothetical protein
VPTTSPAQTLEQIRTYLLEGFPKVTVAHTGEARMGTVMVNVTQGRVVRVVEITETFLDANTDFARPVDALRKWDLIGKLKSVEGGSIVRVTTSGLREV